MVIQMAPEIPETKAEVVLTAKRVHPRLPFAMFGAVLVGSVGMIGVLFSVAPSVEAFVYTLRRDIGVYFVVCSGLAATGTMLAYRDYRGGLRLKWLPLGVAISLVLADGVLATVLSPLHKDIVGFLRHLPTLTPAHVILLLVVSSYSWRASGQKVRATEGSDAGAPRAQP
jgi:hypothetical protein